MIREARAFYPVRYKVLSVITVLLLLGLVVFTSCGLPASVETPYGFIFFTLWIPLLVLVECYGDYSLFGGCLTRDYRDLDLLKTSSCGDAFYARVVKADIVRRIVSFVVAFVLGCIANSTHPWAWGYLFYGLSSAFLGIMITVSLTRRFGSTNAFILLLYLGIAITSLLTGIGTMAWIALRGTRLDDITYTFLPGLLPMLISVLLVWITTKRTIRKWKEQYHDAG